MELPQEAYLRIIRYVGNRGDLSSLCRVSRGFRRAAERALYNTIDLRRHDLTMSICRVLATTPRLSILVAALSIYVHEEESDDEAESATPADGYWHLVRGALRRTTRLRFLSIYFEGGGDAAQAWIFDNCTFQLRTFHCDLEWDEHLSQFFRTQQYLTDLYIVDYKPTDTLTMTTLEPGSLPRLSILECTFSEAAAALVPDRPITRLKTCFSRSKIDEKRAEMKELFAGLRRSRKHLRALDIADSSYTQEFSLELLTMAVNTFSNFSNLRYLGTLVLPIGSRERLDFYGTLMRFSQLQCVEVEVSDWEPAPTTLVALRALTLEMRIYCPSLSTVVFVYEFERVMMRVVDHICSVDNDAVSETLWREI